MSLASETTNQITGNAARLAGKANLQAKNVLKRPALGEIGNTLDRFKVPGFRNGPKKAQALKGGPCVKDPTKLTIVPKDATYIKDPTKVPRVTQTKEARQLKHAESSASLFSLACLKEESDVKSTTAAGTPKEIEDIDKDDWANPLLVASYAPEIFQYLLDREQLFPIKPDFLAGQDITPKMRAVLVDWLVDVQGQYKLLQETLFLTISIMDRYLQAVQTDKKDLQLVGVASLFIAGKCEEIYYLDVAELTFVTDDAYSKKELLNMEKRILKELDFDLNKPVSLQFLRRYSKVSKVLPIHHSFSKYFLEWSLMDYELCQVRPSRLAAAAVFIATWKSDNTSAEIWNQTIEHYSGVSLAEVQTTAVKMARVLLKAQRSKHEAIGRKYSSAKMMKVSQRPELTSEAFKDLANGILP